jgi:Tfp pilus assembly protein PilF
MICVFAPITKLNRAPLSSVNNLGILYWQQGKRKEAEEMYMRALRGFEEAKHTSTLETVYNLGNL